MEAVEFSALWKTLVSSPPNPALPKVNRLTALAGFEAVGGGVELEPTEMTAELDMAGSASLVAVIVSVPGLAGAVYSPEAVIVPRAACQVTALSEVEP